MSNICKAFLLRKFMLDCWCKSKMYSVQRFCLNFSIKSIISLDVTKNDLLSAIGDLESFERSARIFDRNKGCKYFQLQSLFVLILNIIQALHSLVLSITNNETLIFYLGDFFVSSSERKVLNYIVHCGIIMPCMVKIFLLYLNQSRSKSFLHIFDEYKESLQKSNREFRFSLENEKSFRKSYYLSIKLYTYIIFCVNISFWLLHSANIIYNYSSLDRFVIQLINLVMVLTAYYPILVSALWLLLIMMIVGFFMYNSIESLKNECTKLKLEDHTSHQIESFYFKFSLLSNWIDCVNAQTAWIFMAIYVYGAFHNILIFFYFTQFKFNNLGVKLFLIFCNTLILTVIYADNYTGSLISQKAGLLHRSIYRLPINTGKIFDPKVALKKLQALERLAVRKMGIYIGNYIYLGNYYTLILTLECGSLYFLFCTNINRKNQ